MFSKKKPSFSFTTSKEQLAFFDCKKMRLRGVMCFYLSVF